MLKGFRHLFIWIYMDMKFLVKKLLIVVNLHPPGRFDYSHSYRESYADGSSTVPPEFGTNMMYFYDDGNRVQMYTIEESLLKEYIKRQM